MNIQSYKELIVWQKSMVLCNQIYKITESFPQKEIFGLVSQMRRCAVSIPSNIAEGTYRGSRKDFAQFLRIARGSTAELETQLEISINQRFIVKKDVQDIEFLIEEVSKMLSVLIKKLQTAH